MGNYINEEKNNRLWDYKYTYIYIILCLNIKDKLVYDQQVYFQLWW